MERIKLALMGDYNSFPLWNHWGDDVDPRSLPITPMLAADVLEWGEAYDHTLNQDDPRDSGFLSEADAARFNIEGQRLHRELQRELGRKYIVHLTKSGFARDSAS